VKELEKFLRDNSREGCIGWDALATAARAFTLTAGKVEEAALETGILPRRYLRNQTTLSIEQQLRLFRSKVAVVGCGGLGGYIIEELARLGVGTIVAFDPDVFAEHNLNRQMLSSLSLMGCPKAEAAAARVQEINPATTLTACRLRFEEDEARVFFQGVMAVADGLDSIKARLELARLCDVLAVPLVHGAIGGWYGQVTTQYPGDRTLQELYGGFSQNQGVEKILGNPSPTPAVIASIQAAEVCKVLMGTGTTLRRKLLTVNLQDMEFQVLEMAENE
jgi:molybdopterin/thiamine biosynthesis adenylyltransferase